MTYRTVGGKKTGYESTSSGNCRIGNNSDSYSSTRYDQICRGFFHTYINNHSGNDHTNKVSSHRREEKSEHRECNKDNFPYSIERIATTDEYAAQCQIDFFQ
ncbi:glycine-rich protein [Striga asiatica]|uniref:Glycine-rich protein n=1 Tax=Striga asiatica TaxID=4170 RepID=A0A5A7QZL1_STRAF|nr:glycine-rich protein [Striga asiatica]